MAGNATTAAGLTHTPAGAWARAWAIVEAIGCDSGLEIHHTTHHDDRWGARCGDTSPDIAGARRRLGADRVRLVEAPYGLAASLVHAGHTADLVVVPADADCGGYGATAGRVAAAVLCPVAIARPVVRAEGPFAGQVVVGVDGSVAVVHAAAPVYGVRADAARRPATVRQ